ncbi:glycoside hydrolase N-terminal domain-containing protein [Mycoplasma sp. CSL10166]|uniref:glycosyl hydrolase family 95 catalytic domain-containing protein n=1 Tax=Mycoplasma sp. CSL10166 TaxID=2813825 RepID=UPI00197C640A|nr:glycoside hydrolase N-terminal domain-containing protein [Mycoplasma sp. CSL10166]MBN4084412.1 glycoside hydrolase N-terminal domain-containing protein [Mycoplasma sp. CSL10166]
MKFKKILIPLLSSVVSIPSFLSISTQINNNSNSNEQIIANQELELKYNEIISNFNRDNWMNNGLGIGNGDQGATIFGGVRNERIQLNEKTIWTGGPKSNEENNGGNTPIASENNKHHFEYLDQIRKLLSENKIEEAKQIANSKFIGPHNRLYGKYISMANVDITERNAFEQSDIVDYSKSLNISKSLTTVSYKVDETEYTREYFASYPDDVIVISMSAKGKNKLNFDLDLTGTNNNEQLKQYTKNIDLEKREISLDGIVKDNGLKFASVLRVKEIEGENNTITKEGNKLRISNASKVYFVIQSKSDYELKFPTYRKENFNPLNYIKNNLDKLNKTYEQIKSDHIKDYKSLFDRVKLNIAKKPEYKNLKDLIDKYRNNTLDRNSKNYLEQLLFQFGRYLAISGSRPHKDYKSLPTNLQGIWNMDDAPAWNSDYHLNVNLQMNYWASLMTNLSETIIPLLDYIDDLRLGGRLAAKEYSNIASDNSNPANGWLAHTQATPFGFSAPGWEFNWGWSPASNAWIVHEIYNHFEYTLDEKLFVERIFPLLEETAKFWDQYLYYDQKTDRWVSAPSFSPEHGTVSLGNTYDQSLVAQLFIDYINATNYLSKNNLGNFDSELVRSIKEKQPKLKPLNIGDDGQIKEWYEEGKYNRYKDGRIISNDNRHRHTSQLIGLFPGNIFEKEEDIQAAKKTLELRGNFGAGWGKANKINLWANLYEGNNAHSVLEDMFTQNNIMNNLWDNIREGANAFQIEANFGIVSGIAQMLLQSNKEYIKLLPALPDAYNDGNVSGLLARGNFTIDLDWKNKNLKYTKIKSNVGGDLKLEYNNIAFKSIYLNGEKVSIKPNESDKIVIRTQKNDIVEIADSFSDIKKGVTYSPEYENSQNSSNAKPNNSETSKNKKVEETVDYLNKITKSNIQNNEKENDTKTIEEKTENKEPKTTTAPAKSKSNQQFKILGGLIVVIGIITAIILFKNRKKKQ